MKGRSLPDSEPHRVTHQLTVVHGEGLEEAWEVYESSFEELKRNHPCRQSLHRIEFDEFMANTEVTKLFVKEDGELVAGSLFTKNFALVPWISPQYYDEHFPEYIHRRMYAQSFFVRPDKRGKGILQTLAHEMRRYMNREGLAVAFCDFGGRNDVTFKFLLRVVRGESLPSARIQIQSYNAIIIEHSL